MRSQASTSSNPPPSANPFTAAMIGLKQFARRVSPPKPPVSPRRSLRTCSGPCSAWNFRSFARAERLLSRAGQDRYPLVRVVLERVERLFHLPDRVGMQGVHHLRAVDRHGSDVVGGRYLDELVAHGIPLHFRAASAPRRRDARIIARGSASRSGQGHFTLLCKVQSESAVARKPWIPAPRFPPSRGQAPQGHAPREGPHLRLSVLPAQTGIHKPFPGRIEPPSPDLTGA